MSEIAKRLRDRRLNVWEQAKALAERAAEENREFSADEQGQWDVMNEEIEKLDTRIKSALDTEKRAKDAEETFNQLNGKPKEREENRGEQDENPDELRAFLRGESGRAFTIPHLGLVEQRDRLVSNSGGVVPTGFRARLWEYLIETSGVLNAGVDLMETASGETIKLPRVTGHSTAAAAAEGTGITESDPTFGSVDSTVTKEGYLVQLSSELVTDSGVDLEGYLARAAGRALGEAIGEAAVTAALAAASAGVTLPNGTGLTTGFGAQSDADRGFDTLIDVFHSVIDPYRKSRSCSWLMADATAAKVRKIKDADGRYAWQPAVTLGAPDTILAKPVFIDPNVPVPAANAESILFGDWMSLVVRIAGGIRFERSDDFAFGSDLVSYRALVRHGSVSVDANALKSLTHAAAEV